MGAMLMKWKRKEAEMTNFWATFFGVLFGNIMSRGQSSQQIYREQVRQDDRLREDMNRLMESTRPEVKTYHAKSSDEF